MRTGVAGRAPRARRAAARHGPRALPRAPLPQPRPPGQPAVAVARGDLAGRAPLLARVHSSCVTSEVYGACDCDCAEQLDAALAAIAARRARRPLLSDAGRTRRRLRRQGARPHAGAGERQSPHHLRRLRPPRARTRPAPLRRGRRGMPPPRRQRAAARPHQQSREAGGAARRRRRGRRAPAARGRRVALQPPLPRRQVALRAPLLSPTTGTAAALPERVRRLRPRPVRGLPRFLELASYLLPLRTPTPAPAWFRLHLYLDVVARRERVVLTHGLARRPQAAPLVHVQHDALLERFPLRRPRLARMWAAAAPRSCATARAACSSCPPGECSRPRHARAPRAAPSGAARAAGQALPAIR